MVMKYVLTIWLCFSGRPMCAPADDPTGPPTTMGDIDTYLDCEEVFAIRTMPAEIQPPPGMVGRHTCKPQGEDL